MLTTEGQRQLIPQVRPVRPTTRLGSPEWAAGEAERLLAAELPEKWAHTQEVAAHARSVAHGVRADDRDVLIAAAYLHDIGYADSLAASRFHPLDGAVYLHDRGLDRLACLVAHHTGARVEAEKRGLTDQLAWFQRSTGPVVDALTYSDVIANSTDEAVHLGARTQTGTELYGMVARTLRRASRGGPRPDPLSVTTVGLGCLTIVRVLGEFTESNADRANVAFEAVLNRAPHAVVIDMAMVTALDTFGADVLAAVADHGATVTLVDTPARDRAVLQAHSRATWLPMVDGIEPALALHCG